MEEARTNASQADHDLLIRLDTKMDRATNDIQSVDKKVSDLGHDLGVMSEVLETKIAAAVANKADVSALTELKLQMEKNHDDHEKRVRRLEKYVWTAIGGLALLQIVIAFAQNSQ